MIVNGLDLSNLDLPDQTGPIAAEEFMKFLPIRGRVLHIDADSLAYRCSGSDECPAGVARNNMQKKIADMQRVSRAEKVVLHLTHGLGDKGGRFNVAISQEYQGQRNASKRPKNWQHLRECLERDVRSVNHIDREADDGMAQGMYKQDNVLTSPDKDMLQIPGWHLNWNTLEMRWVYSHIASEGDWKDRCFGAWMLLYQCIAGDDADNIPGLEYFDIDWLADVRPDMLSKAQLKWLEKHPDSKLSQKFNHKKAGPQHAVEFLQFYGVPSLAAKELVRAYRAWFRKWPTGSWADYRGNKRPDVTADHLLQERLLLLGLVRFQGDNGLVYFQEILNGEHDKANQQPDTGGA